MPKIDAHQHFWRYDPKRDDWITPELGVIRRDFLPEDLQPLLVENGMAGSVLVQSVQSEAENEFYLHLAQSAPFIKGVVAWTDLRHPQVAERLQAFLAYPLIKGFRHVLQGEADRALMLKADFQRGMYCLEQAGYTYDLLILPDQLGFAAELATVHDRQRLVIDHLAKPLIRTGQIRDWKASMERFRGMEHVYCKISGMITEADWLHWKPADLEPYMDVILSVFGCHRIMFGSDWPVCLVAGSYHKWVEVLENYFAGFSVAEKEDFWGGNATRFYNLS